jgi:hypothetical protein
MTSRVARVAFIFVAFLTQYCSSSDSMAPILLDNSSSGSTLSARVGDAIHITLQTIGPGRYGDPTVSSPAVRFISESDEGTPNPGGPVQLYIFQASTTGTAIVAIPHTGDLPGQPQTPAFTLTVNVSQ